MFKFILEKVKIFYFNAKCNILLRNRQDVLMVVKKVIKGHLTYLDINALYDIVQTVFAIEQKNLNGILVETGCALGGSAIVIASAKNKERNLLIYDVFDRIPPPSEKDSQDIHDRYEIIASGQSKGLGENLYYGYENDLYHKVLQALSKFRVEANENNIQLIKGLYQDTLKIDSPVAFAHIDCDWYDSVLTCLQQIEPHLVSGGVLIIDDYYTWSGCKKAVDEYFFNKNNYKFINKTRLHIIKQ
ncbi:TylF/MycF/NovP-related O-methyltransferase [Synechocystis sp. PCC 7509]|uniref:TylF/MycF/NovP-related O-methyltransferase n=1 Tax=Synechocystis sp. PCC 7509 TaxID=927677 RepID=UPI0002ABCE7A|nr:TylF/MycF/NovP-related O-methyltransferase [Synechocystis sp. PCC 7509]